MANYSLRLLGKVDLCPKLVVRSGASAVCTRPTPAHVRALAKPITSGRLQSGAECRHYELNIRQFKRHRLHTLYRVLNRFYKVFFIKQLILRLKL